MRVDVLSVPFAHTVANHGVTKIMDSRPDPTGRRLNASTAQYLDQKDAQSTIRVAPTELLIPEQAAVQVRRPSGLLAGLPAAFLAGSDRDLLDPLRFLPPGETPSGPAPAVSRADLAAALAVANRGYGHENADALAAKLADPATRVVVTGQQPGLLGGPLYAFAKMMAAARWAAELEARGEPAVGITAAETSAQSWSSVATQ